MPWSLDSGGDLVEREALLVQALYLNPLFDGQPSARSTHRNHLSSDPAKPAEVMELIAVMGRTRPPMSRDITF